MLKKNNETITIKRTTYIFNKGIIKLLEEYFKTKDDKILNDIENRLKNNN